MKLQKERYQAEIKRYRDSIKNLQGVFNREWELQKSFLPPASAITGDLNDIQKTAIPKVKELMATMNAVIEKESKNGNFNLTGALQEVMDFGGLSNISDYDASIEILKNALAQFKNERNAVIAEYGKGSEESANNLLNIIRTENNLQLLLQTSAENWGKLTMPIQRIVDEVESFQGVTLETSGMVGTYLDKLKYDAKVKSGELAKETIDGIVRGIEEADLNQKLEAILEGDWAGAMERVNAVTAEYTWESLEAQKTALEEQLTNFKGTHEQQLEILAQYYSVVEEMAQKHADLQNLQTERTRTMIEDLLNMTDQLGSALDTMQSSWKSVTDAELNAGIISKKEADKKKKQYLEMEKVATAFNVATILGDLATGSFDIWRGFIRETTTINPQTAQAAGMGSAAALAALNAKSLISAIAKQTSLAATASAQIAAARGKYKSSAIAFSQETGSEGGNVGVAAAPALIDSNPYTYTRTVQTTDEEDRLNQPIFVTVTDIENGLGQRAKVTQETSF